MCKVYCADKTTDKSFDNDPVAHVEKICGRFILLPQRDPFSYGVRYCSWILRSLLCGLLARHHAEQDLFDRVEFGGVDKRIGADVEVRDEQRHVETDVGEYGQRIEDKYQSYYVERHP